MSWSLRGSSLCPADRADCPGRTLRYALLWQLAVCAYRGRRARLFCDLSTYSRFGVSWHWWPEPYVVAGHLGVLGRCIYCSEVLGVRMSSNRSFRLPLTGHALGEQAPNVPSGTNSRSILVQSNDFLYSRCSRSYVGRLVAKKFLKFPAVPTCHPTRVIHQAGDHMFERRIVYCSPSPSHRNHVRRLRHLHHEHFFLWRGIKLTQGKADESWTWLLVRVVGYCWVIVSLGRCGKMNPAPLGIIMRAEDPSFSSCGVA